jgi:hypothetical protein
VNDGSNVWQEVSPPIRLANAQWLTGRNAAGTAEINALRVTSGNTLEMGASVLLSGNLDFSVSGGQIKFPATQNASADANTLDDYEEGDWTPIIGGSATYTTQEGKYTKIGRLVTIHCRLTINAIGTGSATTISGLPFTSAATHALVVGASASLAVNVVSIAARTNSATIELYSRTVAAAADTLGSVLGNSASVTIGGSYIIV